MFRDIARVLETVQQGFYGRGVLVVGDLILDRHLWGRVDRISPEAPVPVVRLDHTTHATGGAANVAANLSALGCKVSVAGVLGADAEGVQLEELLRQHGIDGEAVIKVVDRPTICKSRILGGQQQVLRFDVEKVCELGPEVRRDLVNRLENRLAEYSAIVISDYGKGLLDDHLCRKIIRMAQDRSLPFWPIPRAYSTRSIQAATCCLRTGWNLLRRPSRTLPTWSCCWKRASRCAPT
jgi:D-beta-D-heptose 7-phosphate kinase / D-beta-D-heptose 1-phosphate adenosyltransferase